MDIVEDLRGFEADHEPDGWPAVRMRQISALCDEVERLRDEVSSLEASPISEEALDILRGENKRLRSDFAVLRDSAKDVIAWCDAHSPAGDALYCITRLRHAIETFKTHNAGIQRAAKPSAGIMGWASVANERRLYGY